MVLFERLDAAISRHRLEALKAQRQPIAIWTILNAARQVDGLAVQSLEGFQHRTIVLPEQPLGHMQPVVRVDADQMGVERGVMDLGKRNAVRNHRLAKLLVPVRDDMSRVEQQRLGQARQRAAAIVGGDHGFAERRLVQPLFDGTQGVAPFECGLGRRKRP